MGAHRVLALAMLLAGCGSRTLTAETFCARFGQAKADFQIRCGFLGAEGRALAERQHAWSCTRDSDRRFAPVWKFDIARAQTCLDALAVQGCFDGFARCRSEWEGTLGKYGPPSFSCNMATAIEGTPPECSPYVAEVPSAEGATCDVAHGCAQLGCQPMKTSSIQSSCGTCVPCPTSGCAAGCGLNRCLGHGGDPCSSAYDCVSLRCTGGTCSRLALGAECALRSDCQPRAYCKGLKYELGIMFSSTLTPGICTPRIALGDACVEETVDDGCVGPDGRCLDGMCKAVTPYSLVEGQACDLPNQCAPGLWCADLPLWTPGNGTCRPYQAAGGEQPCTSCASTNSGAPGDRLEDGQACTSDHECKSWRCDSPCPGGCADGTPSRCVPQCQ